MTSLAHSKIGNKFGMHEKLCFGRLLPSPHIFGKPVLTRKTVRLSRKAAVVIVLGLRFQFRLVLVGFSFCSECSFVESCLCERSYRGLYMIRSFTCRRVHLFIQKQERMERYKEEGQERTIMGFKWQGHMCFRSRCGSRAGP